MMMEQLMEPQTRKGEECGGSGGAHKGGGLHVHLPSRQDAQPPVPWRHIEEGADSTQTHIGCRLGGAGFPVAFNSQTGVGLGPYKHEK